MGRASWLAVGAIAGALLAQSFAAAAPAVLLAGAGAAILVGLFAFARADQRLVAGVAGMVVVVLRASMGVALAATDGSPAVAAQPGLEGATGWSHEATVISISAPSGGTQKAVVELRATVGGDRVFATLPRYPEIAPGDVIRFGGALEPAPDDDGFGAYLARSGISYTTRARELERLGADGSPVAALEQMRRWAAAAIAVGLPQPEAGLAGAMSIGLRDLVPRDVTADFRVSGLSHVVAISGWHIAMLGAVVSGLLRGIGRRPRSLLVLVAIAGYALFAGASPSILRAAVMASVVLLARESGRRGSAATALALTVTAMAVLDPASISDVGFQLSAAATAGLLIWGKRANDWLAARLPRRTPGWLMESLAVSGAAQAATLPLVLYHFGSLSLVAPLANLLVAPLVAPAMLLTAVAFACGVLISIGLPAVVFAPLAIVGSLVIGGMIAVANLCAGLPFASVGIGPPLNILAAVACCGGLLLTLRRSKRPTRSASAVHADRILSDRRDPRLPVENPRRPRHRVRLSAATAALVLLLLSANATRADGRLHVYVLDVGQGDSILIEGPNGGRALVDGGPDPDRLVGLLDARIPLWDRRIDLVVLTHPHEDHVAGLAAVLARYRVAEVVEPGMVGPARATPPIAAAWRSSAARAGSSPRVTRCGSTA